MNAMIATGLLLLGGAPLLQTLAPAVKKVLEAARAVRSASPAPASKFAGGAVPENSAITGAAIDRILSATGETNYGMSR